MSYALFKRGKHWHYDFQVARKRYRRSTWQTTRAAADRVASRAFRNAEMAAMAAESMPTLRELVDRWLQAHDGAASPAHLKNVRTFGRIHLYDLADTPIDKIRTEDVERARARHMRKRSRATANKWLKILHLLTRWAVRRGMMQSSPWDVQPLKVQERPRPVLPLELAVRWLGEVDRAATGMPGVAMVVKLILGLGLRISEAVGARWEWVDFGRNLYTPGRTKGKEADPIPLPGWLREALLAQRKGRGLIAPGLKGRPADQRMVRIAMHRANEACQLHGITPHRLRGTYATALSAVGVPVQDVKAALRHKDWRTTIGYLERNLDRTREGVDRMAEKMGFQVAQRSEKRRQENVIGTDGGRVNA